MGKPVLVAIDQGTTSSRAIAFDTDTKIVAIAQQEFPQLYPADGWVEHNPADIWDSTLSVTRLVLKQCKDQGYEVLAIGITNQRETTLAWHKETGETICNAIVWQDRRTADYCNELRERGHENKITAKTGLLLDPYFSASKMAWILEHVSGARELADKGLLAFGTVDCYLIWRLTNGQSFVTDATNACRTNLFNIHTQLWDSELLHLYQIPESCLPQVLDCAADFGTSSEQVLGKAIPILGVAGDQHAATVGQGCFNTGDIKSTYGTGCFVVMNTGNQAIPSQHRLLTTLAYRLNGEVTYALEGSIFVAGAAVQWLRDSLKLLDTAAQSESMAESLAANEGVYLVPAFTGMGAPYWRPSARGAIFGLTRASGPQHLCRATLEAVCYQTYDLLQAMANDGVHPAQIRVDGGMVANNWMMQFLCDILQIPVVRPRITETTALGAAYLAGLQLGVFASTQDIAQRWQEEKSFTPRMQSEQRNTLIKGWQNAVTQALNFS